MRESENPRASLCLSTYRKLEPKQLPGDQVLQLLSQCRPTKPYRAPAPTHPATPPGTWAAASNVPGRRESPVTLRIQVRRRIPAGGTCTRKPRADEDTQTALPLRHHAQAPPT